MSATRLDDLKIEEVSGVDSPANQLGGWMVLKSADDAVQVESQLAALYATLGGASALDNAPENIVKARGEIETFLEELLVEPARPKESLMTKMARLFRKEDEVAKEEPVVEKTETETVVEEPTVEKTETETVVEEPVVEAAAAVVEEPVVEKSAPVEESIFKAEHLEQLETVTETMDVFKEAFSALFDRLEGIEKALTGSSQLDDQLDSVTKGAPTLRDGIISAAMGNRVTIY